MSDTKRWRVSDERLLELASGPESDARAMAAELRELRAARTAGAERVVRDAACLEIGRHAGWPGVENDPHTVRLAGAIAACAAEQLAGIGVGLSAEEIEVVLRMRLMIPAEHLTPAQKMVLNRLLASPPAPDYRAAICAPATPVIAARDPASLTEDEIRVARTAARADQEELIGVVHSCSDVLRYGDRMGPEVEFASRRRIQDYIASKNTVPTSAITALLDSDMPAGELRKALAEIVGLR